MSAPRPKTDLVRVPRYVAKGPRPDIPSNSDFALVIVMWFQFPRGRADLTLTFANGFAASRAQLIKSSAAGPNNRFFKVTTPVCRGGVDTVRHHHGLQIVIAGKSLRRRAAIAGVKVDPAAAMGHS